jgi:hypothetical protein
MRYIEVVGGIGIWRCEMIDGNPVAGYTGYSSQPVVNIGEFTRENVAKYLEIRGRGPECLPVEDFHAVFDDIEIPWTTKEGCEQYRRVMELAAALEHKKEGEI